MVNAEKLQDVLVVPPSPQSLEKLLYENMISQIRNKQKPCSGHKCILREAQEWDKHR